MATLRSKNVSDKSTEWGWSTGGVDQHLTALNARVRVRGEETWAAVRLDRSERNRTHTLPISALARNFCTALSLSSLSAAPTLFVTEVAGVTGAWGCMNAS